MTPIRGADRVTITVAPADDDDNYSDRAVIEDRPRNPRLKPGGGKGAQALRWFATYCLMIPSGAPPTVATK